MAEETSPLRLWAMRGLYLASSMAMILAALLPLSGLPRSVPPPDFILALTLAWLIRRPDQVPLWSVLLVFLLCDVVFLNPPGLNTALVVLATEYIRTHPRMQKEASLPAEVLRVGVIVLAIAIGERILLAVTLSPAPGLGPSFAQAVLTIAVYPAAILVTRIVFAVRHGRGEPAQGATT